jgi:DNA-directed RNA polymerase specialized sigma24 family protein
MMTVRDLIDGCRGDDPEAWAMLWEVVSSAGLYPIRRLLQRQGLGLELADDVMQEFYFYIREGDLHHLRAFRGQAMPQFRAFIRTLAIHFALNTLRKMKRLRRQEAEAARAASPPDRSGPTARQIRSAMQELTSLMSDDDRAKVLQLLGDTALVDEFMQAETSDPSRRSRRTLRRWREELYRKYARRVT